MRSPNDLESSTAVGRDILERGSSIPSLVDEGFDDRLAARRLTTGSFVSEEQLFGSFETQ